MGESFIPKVSIIIPVYNGANFLEEAIESALAQTYKNIEIIVVNDGSQDNGATEQIALSYGSKIRYYHKENGGVSSALNFGIQKMTGEWFSWLSHDDLYTPEKIAHSVEVLRPYITGNKKWIAHTDGYLVNEKREVIKAFRKRFYAKKVYSGLEAAEIVTKTGTLCGCNLLIPKDAFQEVGLFDETLRYSQDALMWFSLFLNGYGIVPCVEKDVLSRVHKNQVTHTRKDLFQHDSMIIAQTLAPLFQKQLNAPTLFYYYTKRLTRLNCSETIEFLLSYANEHKILSQKQVRSIRREQIIGKKIGAVKSVIRNLIVR